MRVRCDGSYDFSNPSYSAQSAKSAFKKRQRTPGLMPDDEMI
jgi:hypothetical protein